MHSLPSYDSRLPYRWCIIGWWKIRHLLDTGASKSYMSKAFYMSHPHLHHFPKFQSAIRHLQVGNGALVPALFVIPLLFKVQGHIFEVYTLVSEIQDKMDLILGVKNIFELEGIVNSRTCSFNFLNRSLPIFPLAHYKLDQEKWPMSRLESHLLKNSQALL